MILYGLGLDLRARGFEGLPRHPVAKGPAEHSHLDLSLALVGQGRGIDFKGLRLIGFRV